MEERDETAIFLYYQELGKQTTYINDLQMLKALNILRQAKKGGNTIYICGNGGSASTSEHWANDLMKIGGVKAISITTLPVITAYANDMSYQDIFVEQLKILLKEGDVVIGITGSGNSPNIIKALEFALQKGATPLAILGFDGGKIKEMEIPYVLVRSKDYGIIEDMHISIGHIFAKRLSGSGVVL